MEARHLPLSTPVLIGRDDLLALGRRRVASARAGDGHVLFLAGEAGIGKTRLLGAIVREASRQGMRVLAAGASPRDVEVPAALLLDLGHRLATSRAKVERDAGSAILDRLAPASGQRGDPHRRRRMMVLDVTDRLVGLAAAGPLFLALEDLHWADDLALEVVGQLARRLGPIPLLVVGTYRSDELYPRIPMREWRARLLTQRLAEEARLARLTPEQTAAMVDHLLPGPLPAPADLVQALRARSDGIPLHVEEILGAMRLDAAAERHIPDTLVDAVLARRDAMGREAVRVAEAAAVIGRSFDLDFVAAVAGRPLGRVAAALAELEARYFVVPAQVAGWFEVRHSLIRDALEGAMSLSQRRTAHELVAQHAAARADLADDGFLSSHFEAAARRDEAYHHARAAATRAASLSAHREALDLYRRAVRCAPADLPLDEQAGLLAARAAEEAATDDNESSAASYAEARRLLLAAGQADAAAALLPRLVAARHLLGDSLEARVQLLESGFDELRLGVTELDQRRPVEARLEAGLSAAYMLDRRLDEALEHGQRAIDLAAGAGNDVTELNALVTQGATLVFAGRMGEGWTALEQSVRRARAARLEAEAARAYRMIGTAASVVVEYERAEAWLRDGIAYAERTEQWNHRHYMASHLGHVLWATGAWSDAVEVTQHAMADGRGGITTRITSLHVIGYLALGHGDWDAAQAALSEARRIGDEMAELQRFSPAVWGLAEMAQLRGDNGVAAELTTVGREASTAVRDAAYLYPYLVTGTRARLALGDIGAAETWLAAVTAELRDRSIPGTLPAIDHAGGLVALAHGRTGQAREMLVAARRAWEERRRTWEWVTATVELARCALRANRPAEAASLAREAIAWAEPLGAEPLLVQARALEATLRQRGVREERWAPLTAREFEVATLIATGRTNREIAAELTITPKTVASHVEHILGRLGADRRTEIAAWVASVQAG